MDKNHYSFVFVFRSHLFLFILQQINNEKQKYGSVRQLEKITYIHMYDQYCETNYYDLYIFTGRIHTVTCLEIKKKKIVHRPNKSGYIKRKKVK